MTNPYEKPYLKIEELERSLAEQAAVIEKLRKTILAVHNVTLPSETLDLILEALAIPTDSKQILAEWLDSVMGEAVAWERPYEGDICTNQRKLNPHTGLDSFIVPLFRKPEIK